MLTGLLPGRTRPTPSLPRTKWRVASCELRVKTHSQLATRYSPLATRYSPLALDGDRQHPIDREARAVGNLRVDLDGRGHLEQGPVQLPERDLLHVLADRRPIGRQEPLVRDLLLQPVE